MLDNFPESSWFLCLPIQWGVFCIAGLGIIHPLPWIRVMRVYRSEMFIFIYTIIYIYSILSVALLYAILAESACIFTFWCYYAMAFGMTMIVVLCLIVAGFCVLGKKRSSIYAMLGVIYYCLTLYFMLVVNTRRRELFGMQKHACGDESCNNSIQLTAMANKIDTTTETASKKRHTTKSKYTSVKITRPMKRTRPVKKKVKKHRTSKKPTQPTTEEETEEEMETTTTIETETDASSDEIETTSLSETTETDAPNDEIETTSLSETTASDTEETTTKLKATRKMTMSSSTTKTKTKQLKSTEPMKTKQRKKLGSRNWAMTGLLKAEEPPPYWDRDPVRGTEEPDPEPRRRKNRIPKVTSDVCQMPRKPAHGRYVVHWDRSTLRLRLRCKKGYRENSVATECKYNWWDRPIPQCRKRRDAVPFNPDSGCIMPRHPPHGQYTVMAEPGDRVGTDKVILQVTCDGPYRAVDPYVVCEEGQWRHAPPSCEKHCKLTFSPTVEYKCFKPFKDKFLSCHAWQPNGAIVAAACRPGHAHRGPFKYMRCSGDTWDYEVACQPNANFTI